MAWRCACNPAHKVQAGVRVWECGGVKVQDLWCMKEDKDVLGAVMTRERLKCLGKCVTETISIKVSWFDGNRVIVFREDVNKS